MSQLFYQLLNKWVTIFKIHFFGSCIISEPTLLVSLTIQPFQYLATYCILSERGYQKKDYQDSLSREEYSLTNKLKHLQETFWSRFFVVLVTDR